MDKNKLTTYVIAAITLLALLAAIFLTSNPNATLISYNGSSVPESSGTGKKESSNKSNPKSKAPSRSSKAPAGSQSKEPGGSREESANTTPDNSMDIPSKEKPPETDPPEESSGNSQASSADESQLPELADKISRKLNQLKHAFQVSITIMAPSFSSDSRFTSYTSLSSAYQQLLQVENCLNAVGAKTYHGLSRRGFSFSVILAQTNLSDSAPVSFETNGQNLSFEVQSSKSGWSNYFYSNTMVLYDQLISVQGGLDDVYHNYSALNPTDFVYGRYQPQYINTEPQNTYFISIDGQSSIQSDRNSIFTSGITESLPGKYKPSSCPISRKWAQLQNDIATYVY